MMEKDGQIFSCSEIPSTASGHANDDAAAAAASDDDNDDVDELFHYVNIFPK